MGDLQILSIQPNGFMIEDPLFSPSSQSPLLSNPSPASISDYCWKRAEGTTADIIRLIQPTNVSEQRRKDVIEYVQGLIRSRLGSEVFPFGSVPLKTYLPDGDIDLTALSIQTVEDSLANDVRAVLEREEHNKDAEFEVKDVQYINAEVKLIKCLVQNIVVDISFNQLGGLCTLCFLEQVDCLINKNHLFKRSIILIKAWCYYESRILGAHHGLISTYALETMVLYIFHLFHTSLHGPLAVLYRFLDYYSKFDWDNLCISLYGPVSISSLPEIVAETPDNEEGDLLLDKEFLGECVEMFSVPSKGLDTNSRSFPQKHFNIIDPLKENNNLGRSVSKGNFYRIRSAFTYGARKLGQILLLRADDIPEELKKFFMNTLDRHGGGHRPDVQISGPSVSVNGPEEHTTSPNGSVQDGTSSIQLSGSHRNSSTGAGKEPQRCTTGVASSLEVLERLGYIKENGISGRHRVADGEDHATSRIPDPVVTISATECITQSCELVTSPLGRTHRAPHLSLSPPFRENGKIGTLNPDQSKAKSSALLVNKLSSGLSEETAGEVDVALRKDSEPSKLDSDHTIDLCEEDSTTFGKIDGPLVSSMLDPGNTLVSTRKCLGGTETLPDLCGDYDSHVNSIVCAQWCYGYVFPGLFLRIPPLHPHLQNNHVFDTFHQPIHLESNMFPHMNANGVFPRPHFFSVHPPLVGAAFGVEDLTKHRGTGTYLPNLDEASYKERIFPKRRSVPPVRHGQFLRPLRDSNWVVKTEMHLVGKGSYAPRQEEIPTFRGQARAVPSGFFQVKKPISKGSHPNGFSTPSEKLEFGSFGKLPSPVLSTEASTQPFSKLCSQGYSSDLPTVTVQHRPVIGVNVEGSKLKGYHLKNDTDFPPLAVPVPVPVPVAQSSK